MVTAMSWVGLAAAAEERPEAKVAVAHWHDTIDGDVIEHMGSRVSSMDAMDIHPGSHGCRFRRMYCTQSHPLR